MPLVIGHYSVQVQDYNPTVRAITQPFVCTSGLFTDIAAALTAYLPLLDKVVAGRILKAQVVLPTVLPGGLKAAAVANQNNSVTGLFNWLNATTIDRFGLAYPGWYTTNAGNGWLPASPSLVNQADADVANFIAFNLAITNTTQMETEDGFPYSAVGKAIKSDRSTRKQLARAK